MVFHQFLADGLVRIGGTEQHAVRHDAGALAALFQHPQKQGQEQQLGLFRVGHGLQVVVDALGVNGAFEGRICQANGVSIPDLVLLGNAVLIVDFWVGDRVEHQVHGRKPQHGAVGVKAGKHRAGKMLPLLIRHGIFIVAANIFCRCHQKARRAAGGIADGILRGRPQKLHHHFNDVARRAKLAVLPGGGQLSQHIFV